MRIDYCPNCGKAGLRYDGPGPCLIGSPEYAAAMGSPETLEHARAGEKYCPRCRVWVKPVNRPYVGARGIR